MTSLAQTYILASQVKAKLTREALKPDSNLRKLVTQANMLDNLIDNLKTRRESAVTTKNKVVFAEPARKYSHGPIITNIEIDSDEDDSDEDDEDFVYYSDEDVSDEEDEEYIVYSRQSIDYSNAHIPRALNTIEEEEEEEDRTTPRLTYVSSSDDSDDEEEFYVPDYPVYQTSNKSASSVELQSYMESYGFQTIAI